MRVVLARLVALVVSILSLSGTSFGVDANEPPRSQLSAGLGIGLDQDELSIDGGPGAYQSGIASDFIYRFELGYARRLNPISGFSVLLLGGTWSDEWSASAGELRGRIDLRLSHDISLTQVFLGPRPFARHDVKVSLGVGPTLAGIEPAKHRAIDESYGLGLGLNAGGRITETIRVAGSHGIYAALDLSFFWIWIRYRASVNGDPSFTADERFLFSGHSLCLYAGYAYLW